MCRSPLLFFPAVLLVALSTCVQAQHVADPRASVVDVTARQAFLKATTDARIHSAIEHLGSCAATPIVPAPSGRINIPHHYLSGSHGPTNPAEAEATRVYNALEKRIGRGMDQYVAAGNEAEAKCALDQLDAWAQAKTLLDYDAKESSQAWFQVGWTLCSAGIVESVLVQDSKLDPAELARVNAWLNKAAHKLLSFEKPGEAGNNLHYWRALAATAIGVVSADDKLFRFGVDTYKEAIGEIDANGALPREMERHERASHYQAFALQPLVMIAELAAHQNVDLYHYQAHGRSLRDAIVFFGRAVDDPSIIKQYTQDEQVKDFGAGDFAPFEYYVARFGSEGLPHSINAALQHPASSDYIGGSATVLAAK